MTVTDVAIDMATGAIDTAAGGEPVDLATEATTAELLAQLEGAGTAQNRKIYRRHGASDPMFGVSYAVQNKLAKRIRTDHPVAKALWATGNHDARVLGLKIADPSLVTETLAHRWVNDVDNYILAEALGGLCAATPHARALSDAWRDNVEEWTAATGWFIVTCTTEKPDIWTVPELRELAYQIAADIKTRPNRVRHEMNGALIAMALRDGNLRRSVLAVARRIGPVDVDHGETSCKTPAIEPYVKKTLAHRAKQKQRQAARARKRRQAARAKKRRK